MPAGRRDTDRLISDDNYELNPGYPPGKRRPQHQERLPWPALIPPSDLVPVQRQLSSISEGVHSACSRHC